MQNLILQSAHLGGGNLVRNKIEILSTQNFLCSSILLRYICKNFLACIICYIFYFSFLPKLTQLGHLSVRKHEHNEYQRKLRRN